MRLISCLPGGRIQAAALGLALAALGVAVPSGRAQDTRRVSEPRLPPVCGTLAADLSARAGVLARRDENKLDTARLQQAIDGCPKGGAVVLQAGPHANAFLSGPLELRANVTLIVDAGVTLFASRNPRDYDTMQGSCGKVDQRGKGCRPLIHAGNAPNAAIMGDGIIDGRGGAELMGVGAIWWGLAHEAKVRNLRQNVPRLIDVDRSDGFVLYRITLRDSPNYHVIVSRTNGFTAWGVTIDTPATARNTDGIDPSSSTNVSILHCNIRCGDDNVAIKAGGAGTAIPDFKEITLRNISIERPGKITLLGADSGHTTRVELDNVQTDAIGRAGIETKHAAITIGPGGASFAADLKAGGDVEVKASGANGLDASSAARAFGSRQSSACSAGFPVFPERPERRDRPESAGRTLIVDAAGHGDFSRIQDAIDHLPADGGTVRIRPGVYREVITVAKPNVRLEGDRRPSRVVIVFNRSAGTAGGTLKSATAAISGDGFSAGGITFANDFSAGKPLAPQGSQAVALLVTADRARFTGDRILGAQDSLYAGSKSCVSDHGPCVPARQYFSHCYIEGNVDFIVGDAKAFFDRCEIHCLAHSIVMLTAQSKHYPGQDSGYVFWKCKVTAESGADHIFLGRPWRDFATVIFIDSDLQAHIEPAGWREWHPGETKRLETATYAEFNSAGPGADAKDRDPHSRQLSASEVRRYSMRGFLGPPDGWNPGAGIAVRGAGRRSAGPGAVRGETAGRHAAVYAGRAEGLPWGQGLRAVSTQEKR